MIEIGNKARRGDAPAGPSLLGDVGGSNVRLAWQGRAGAPIERVRVVPCGDFPNLTACIQDYLSGLGRDGLAPPSQAALGVATPVLQDQICLTNRDWSFSAQALRSALYLQRLVVMNDFTALALAIPALPQGDFWHCGGPRAEPPVADAGTLALLGPGTGLGVSGLVSTGDRQWTALQTEGGHVSLAAHNEREHRLILQLARRFGHVSAERVLSGPGLVHLAEALCELDGCALPAGITPAGVIEQAQAKAHAQCVEALELFGAFLGDVAGDLVLSLGARAGVYIGGGVVPRLGPEWIRASRFRQRFEAKGRMAGYLAAVPSYVIASQEPPALLGASRAL